MRTISTILVAFLILATVQTAIAATASINLCEKVVNVGDSWGVCNPADTSKAQGTFTYNTVGASMGFEATATGLSADGISYSLIYYKDTDEEHVLPSTEAVNVLATATSSGGGVASFTGTWTDESIPSVDDVNPRGKIWIVQTSQISAGTLLWSGYGDGLIMNDYLFESDSIAQTEGDGLTVLERMGGITYYYTAPGDVPGTAQVLACPVGVTGIEVLETELVFDVLYPGETSEPVNMTLTATADGFVGDDINSCEVEPTTVAATITASEWSSSAENTMDATSTSVTVNGDEYIFGTNFDIGIGDDTDVEFILTTPLTAIPDTYHQTITVTQIS